MLVTATATNNTGIVHTPTYAGSQLSPLESSWGIYPGERREKGEERFYVESQNERSRVQRMWSDRNRPVWGLLAGLLAILCLLPAAAAERIAGRVVGVTDGDTLRLLVGRREEKIRLHGIDAPEKAQPWGDRSKRNLSDGVFGREVVVEVRERDRYGRLVGVVWIGREDAGLAQVRAGLAWAYLEFSREYLPAQQEAQRRRVGLWSEPGPVPPWDWRRSKRRR